MTDICFADLGLADPIQRVLTDREHVTPTPIQAAAIPQLLNGEDILGIAQTGTGKTGAFALPILHKLSRTPGKNAPHSPRALILAPTRELAIQIGDEFRAYGKRLHLRQTVIFGGVSQAAQVKAISRGVEILIATPGRLLDLVNQGRLGLDAVEHFVMDEADRMLDMGFIHDIRKIKQALPKKRQSLLFSATMGKEVTKLSAEFLSDPIRIEITPQATPVDRIKQSVHHVKSSDKGSLLANLLEDPKLERVIVFSRTKHRANRIAEHLEKQGVTAEAIHGNKSQAARQRALRKFRSGSARVLVATDVAARGIDIGGITHVINYELPNEPESYVHRIGRTARAGNYGIAIAFCDATERAYLRDIELLIRQELDVIGEKPTDPIMAPPKQNRGGSRGPSRTQRKKAVTRTERNSNQGRPPRKNTRKNRKPVMAGRRKKKAA